MESSTLELIKAECEKIEKSSGFGQVLIVIQDGKIHHIKPTQSIFVQVQGLTIHKVGANT